MPSHTVFRWAQNITYCKYFNPWDWEHRHHKYHEEQGIAIPVICLKPRTRFGFEQTDARQMNYGEKKHNYMKHKRDTQEFQILLGQHNLPNRPNKTFWKQITIDNAVQALAMEASWNHHLANLISPAKLECLLEQPVRWAGSPGSLGIESTLDGYFNLNLLPGMGILNQHQQTHWMWQLVGCVQKRTMSMPQFIDFLNIFNREHDEPGVTISHSLTKPKPTKRIGMRVRLSGFKWFNPKEGISSAKQMRNIILQ